MNYYIEKQDMNIILDALELLSDEMKIIKDNGDCVEDIYGYSIEYVDGLFESLNNSGEEPWDLK